VIHNRLSFLQILACRRGVWRKKKTTVSVHQYILKPY